MGVYLFLCRLCHKRIERNVYAVLVSGDRSFTDTRVLFVPSTVSRLTLKNLPEVKQQLQCVRMQMCLVICIL
eukprot:m.78999 g.78999  ORF g.78999 m.78999 type:complete len:72 (+) comp11975_c1_seq3:1152-1367(+)